MRSITPSTIVSASGAETSRSSSHSPTAQAQSLVVHRIAPCARGVFVRASASSSLRMAVSARAIQGGDRAHVRAECLGHLGEREVEQVAQHEHRAVVHREPREAARS